MTRTSATRRPIETGTVARIDDELLTAEVGGELVGMSLEQGACYGFNGVATRVWALLAEPRSLDGLCEQLCTEFEVEPQQCRAEVLALLEELHAEGLVRAAHAE